METSSPAKSGRGRTPVDGRCHARAGGVAGPRLASAAAVERRSGRGGRRVGGVGAASGVSRTRGASGGPVCLVETGVQRKKGIVAIALAAALAEIEVEERNAAIEERDAALEGNDFDAARGKLEGKWAEK